MNISAQLENSLGNHSVTLPTNDHEHTLAIHPKPEGFGSGVNGGELLFLALTTCYCNDLYREARKRHIEIRGVRVEVTGVFAREGEGARNIRYRSTVDSPALANKSLN